MLILLLIYLLVSNALTTRRDKSILFSRIVIKGLLMISFLTYNNMYLNPLSKDIGILNLRTFTVMFSIFDLLDPNPRYPGIDFSYILTNFYPDPEKIKFTKNNIVISSSISLIMSVLTSLLLLFIYIPGEWFNIVSIFRDKLIYLWQVL